MSEASSVRVVFGSLSAGLLFLKRSLPRASHDAWQLVQTVSVLNDSSYGPFSMNIPEILLSGANAKRTLEICDGALEKIAKNRRSKTATGLDHLFKSVAFNPTSQTERARRFIVLPRDGRNDFPRLIGALASLPDWETSVHTAKGDNETNFFLLKSASGLDGPIPIGLPGAPITLAELAEEVFVPPGQSHPFLPDYRFLFPPLDPGERHIWVPNSSGSPEYTLLKETPNAGVPLARRVTMARIRSTSSVAVAAASNIAVPLELHKSRKKNNSNRNAGSAVYRIETRASEFGPLLLRFLDHAEAGIEKFTLYVRSLGEGPNAVIEHYLLSESRIHDEISWPELECFYCPRILEDLNLPIFLPENRQFAPDIEGLLRIADADEPLLAQLAEAMGFPPEGPARTADAQQKIAVILPESDSQNWSVLHLENGRPLIEAIRAISAVYNRESVRRVLPVNTPSLIEERKNYEERWIAAGAAEAAEIAAITQLYAQEMSMAASGIDGELAEHEKRLTEVQEHLQAAAALVTEQLPQSVRDYSEKTAKILSELAAPQHAWLREVDERKSQLEQIRQATEVLQRQATEEVNQLNNDTVTREREISEAQQQLASRSTALQGAAKQMADSVARAQTAAQQATATMTLQRAELVRQRAAIEIQEREILQEDARLTDIQREVEQREAEVAERRRLLGLRQQGLERRVQQAQRSAQAAEQEQERLNRLENVEIPALEERLAEANAKLRELRDRGIDAAYSTANAELPTVNAALTRLEKTAEELKKRKDQLDAAKSRRALLEQEIDQLLRSLEVDKAKEERLTDDTKQSLRSLRDATRAIAVARGQIRAAREYVDSAKLRTPAMANQAIHGVESDVQSLESTLESMDASVPARPEQELPANGKPTSTNDAQRKTASWFKRIFR